MENLAYVRQEYAPARNGLLKEVARPKAAAVFFHGGGWVGGTPHQFDRHTDVFAEHAIKSCLIEYSLTNKHRTSIYDSLNDTLRACPFVASWAAGAPIFLIGASAGGLLAFHAASRGWLDVTGLVLLNAVLDLSEDGFKSKATPPGGDLSLSPLHLPVDRLPPTLLFQGSLDQITPIETCRRFRSKLIDEGVSVDLLEQPGGVHGFFNQGEHMQAVVDRMIAFIDARIAPL